MKAFISDLSLSQLDKRFSHLRKAKDSASITGGWIRFIRRALGLTQSELSVLANLSTASIAQAERREAEGKVTLSTLNKLAEAMNCEVVYSLVPKKSIKDTVHDQAYTKALKLLNKANLNMKLEDQGVDKDLKERAEILARKLIEKGDIW